MDSSAHYANADLLERYVTQPSIMAAFGWKINVGSARDWYFEPEAVLERIERLLRVEERAEVEAPAEVSAAKEDGGAAVAQVEPALPTLEVPGETAVAARRLEFTEDGSRKFWEITCDGCEVTTRFGRIGTKGQTHTKQLASAELAVKEAKKLAAEKLRKGYRELA